MKFKIFPIVILLLSAPTALADSNVDKLRLDWLNGEVVAQIDVSGPFQFSHQIEEAKNGKPFRVIVDVFPSIHKLGQKSFLELPPSIIRSIRTSQYSVQPEKTVRIVLDLKSESVYRIEKKGTTIFLYLPDKSNSGFPGWSSVDPGQARRLPQAVKTDRRPLESPPVAISAESEKKNMNEKAAVESTYYKPQRTDLKELDLSYTESRQSPAPLPAKTAKPDPKPADSEIKKATPATAGIEKTIRQSGPKREPAKAAVLAVKPAEKDLAGPVVSGPSESGKVEPVMADRPADTVVEKSSKPTSRFRRKPSLPARLKGTIVAEFPKRMVIKYKPGNSKDPFATLITESKGNSGGLLEKRLLDVETANLVGILKSNTGPNRALVEDMDGYGYILKPGDKIKKGYVSKIYANKALFQIFEYGWSRSHALYLGENE
jgi:hypothetical protein